VAVAGDGGGEEITMTRRIALVLLFALGIGCTGFGLGDVLAGANNSCVMEIEKDEMGVVWWTSCFAFTCPNSPPTCTETTWFQGGKAQTS